MLERNELVWTKGIVVADVGVVSNWLRGGNEVVGVGALRTRVGGEL